MPEIRLDADGAVAVLTIDNPPHNQLTHPMRVRIGDLAAQLAGMPGVRTVVLAGAGDRAFSAGSDLRDLPADAAASMRRTRAEHDAYRQFQHLPQPVVAALHGQVMGAGLELALACDLRVADRAARLGLPEVGLGLFPACGGTQRLPRLIGAARAKELLLLGRPVDAEEALRLGLVNRVVPEGTARAAALELARTIADLPGLAVRAIKEAVDGGLEDGAERGEELERELIARLHGSHDAREGVRAFLEDRTPCFEHR